jgi:hypothetical protein
VCKPLICYRKTIPTTQMEWIARLTLHIPDQVPSPPRLSDQSSSVAACPLGVADILAYVKGDLCPDPRIDGDSNRLPAKRI